MMQRFTGAAHRNFDRKVLASQIKRCSAPEYLNISVRCTSKTNFIIFGYQYYATLWLAANLFKEKQAGNENSLAVFSSCIALHTTCDKG